MRLNLGLMTQREKTYSALSLLARFTSASAPSIWGLMPNAPRMISLLACLRLGKSMSFKADCGGIHFAPPWRMAILWALAMP